MRFLIVCVAAVLAGSVAAGPPARAQQAPEAATAPSARQLALTRRYVELMMSDQFEEAIRTMVGDEAASDASARDLPEEDRRFLVDLTTELTTDMIPQMIDEMVPVYARVLSEEELQALIDFYDSEMGRSIVSKTTQAMPEANRAAMTVMPRLMDKMASRLCQHYGCAPAELESLRREMRGEVAIVPPAK